MNTAIIIHGSYGSPDENWFPWLKDELEKLNYKVYIPHFPTPVNQSLDYWNNTVQSYMKYINKDTILIGHSIGSAFILNILENQTAKVVFLISHFVNPIGIPKFDKVNETFYKKFEWEQIKSNCSNFQLFYSDSDPYVKLNLAKEVATNLNTTLNLIEDKGHFNQNEFPELLRTIKQLF